jgi:hypothetical protein
MKLNATTIIWETVNVINRVDKQVRINKKNKYYKNNKMTGINKFIFNINGLNSPTKRLANWIKKNAQIFFI